VVRYIVRRLLFSIPVLIIASIIVFTAVHLTSDPTAFLRISPRSRPKDIAAVRAAMGLDRSGVAQYLAWLSHFVRGDWGTSLVSGTSVSKDIREALVNTAVLGLTGTALSLVVGIAIGMYSSLRQYTWFDLATTAGAFVGLSIPNFWFALMLQVLFGLYLTRWLHLGAPIFYTAGMSAPGTVGFHLLDRVRHLALPVLVLAVQEIAIYSRYMRASMLEVLRADYLRTARAKGLRERRVVFRHAFRNALIPLTTVAALSIGAVAGGLIITETIFQWPGMGRFFIIAIGNGDYPQVLPWLMVTVAFVVVLNLVADILYAVLDPRIRYS
jgi:peptide/nickel transport system permease protein